MSSSPDSPHNLRHSWMYIVPIVLLSMFLTMACIGLEFVSGGLFRVNLEVCLMMFDVFRILGSRWWFVDVDGSFVVSFVVLSCMLFFFWLFLFAFSFEDHEPPSIASWARPDLFHQASLPGLLRQGPAKNQLWNTGGARSVACQVPEEARFWSEEDLEAFFGSNGHLVCFQLSACSS